MVAEAIGGVVLLLAVVAEWLHLGRIRKMNLLAFGPRGRRTVLVGVAPWIRVLSQASLAWGLTTLLLLAPRTLGDGGASVRQLRHVILLLDVSPSMRLRDAGKGQKLTRMERAKQLVESLFERVPIQQYRVSTIAFYNSAIPVVVDTTDLEVIKNCFGDLPMHFAFKGKETNLFAGLEAAAETAAPWNPKSTILIVITDGDTVPATGMPKMPPSVSGVLLVGVGDPVSGKFIDGRQSRQDVSTLRQVASRIKGEFHNGNEQHISTGVIQKLTSNTGKHKWQDFGKREYAMLAIGLAATLLAALPLGLHYFGSRWRPGVQTVAANSYETKNHAIV